jgi:hypothetical protein
VSDKLEGCLEFLEFGRHGRALHFVEASGFYYEDNTTSPYKEEFNPIQTRNSSKNIRHIRTGRHLKNNLCHCEYET